LSRTRSLPVFNYCLIDAVDIAYLEDLIVKVSDFIDKNTEIKELDLNPVFAYSDEAVAVDAGVILEPSGEL